MRFHLISARLAKFNNTMTPHAGEGVELGNTPPLLYGVEICIATMELEEVVPQKIGN